MKKLWQKLYVFLDRAIDRIIEVSDYFVITKSVHLSEWFLFVVQAGWSLWFTIFEVKRLNPVFAHIISEHFWTGVLCGLATFHLCALFFDSLWLRALVVRGYAVQWFIFAFIVAYTRLASPMLPTLGCLTLAAMIVAVRLVRERVGKNGTL